ncbi:MAG: hypothetical protein ABSF45_27400 [Terriglobia bacterium]|jgi:hypothetical protein
MITDSCETNRDRSLCSGYASNTFFTFKNVFTITLAMQNPDDSDGVFATFRIRKTLLYGNGVGLFKQHFWQLRR